MCSDRDDVWVMLVSESVSECVSEDCGDWYLLFKQVEGEGV